LGLGRAELGVSHVGESVKEGAPLCMAAWLAAKGVYTCSILLVIVLCWPANNTLICQDFD